jgi:hypothetical protein
MDDSDLPQYHRQALILCQRLYLFKLLASGIAVSSLRGAEFRDSKVRFFFLRFVETFSVIS